MCPLSQKHRLDIAQVVAVFEEADACHLHKRHLSYYNVFQQEANQRTSQAHEKRMANKGAKVAPQAPQSDVQNAILAAAAAGAGFVLFFCANVAEVASAKIPNERIIFFILKIDFTRYLQI